MKRLLLALLLTVPAGAGASDAPHNTTTSTECVSCHQGHNAAGMNLTSVAGNANLCLSCHQVSQTHVAAFLESEQADLGARRGFHHRWDSGVAGWVKQTVTAGGSTGSLKSGGDYAGSGGKQYTITITATGSTTTAAFSWSGSGGAGGSGSGTCGSGVALNEGINVTCAGHPAGTLGACGAFFCAGDAWVVSASDVAHAPTNPALTVRMPDGKITCSTCHDQHVQTNASFTSKVVNGSVWKHFMRIPNDAGQLCKECHADRFPADPGNPMALVRTWTGAPRSHPVGVGLNHNGKNYDRPEPLDVHGRPQSEGDGIASNDLLLTTGGEVTCLTCHGMHLGAADGNARTE